MAVLIENADGAVAVLASPKEFEDACSARDRRLFEAMDEMGQELRHYASERGLSVTELETMLDRHTPQNRD